MQSLTPGFKFQFLEFRSLKGTMGKLFNLRGPQCSDLGNGYRGVFSFMEAVKRIGEAQEGEICNCHSSANPCYMAKRN